MLELVTVFIYLINILNSFLKKNIRIISVLLIILMLVIMGFVPSTITDYGAYEAEYFIKGSHFEWGYTLLQNLFSSMGVRYSTFRFILIIVGIVILSLAVKKYTANMSAFYLVYFIYPFFMDIVQVRNFLMMAIIFYASYYLESITIKNTIKYFILVFIAASIQTLAYFFILAFILALFRKKKKVIYIVPILIVAIGVIAAIIPGLIVILNTWLLSLSSTYDFINRLMYYTSANQWTFAFVWVSSATSYLFVLFNYLFVKNDSVDNDIEINDVLKLRIALEFVTVALFAVPLSVMNNSFSRIIRDVFPLIIISSLITLPKLKKSFFAYIYIVLFISVTIVNFLTLVYPPLHTTILSIFYNNTLFNR